MRDLAKANATAKINVYVPQLQYFDKDDLLKPRVKRRRSAQAATAPAGALLPQATAIMAGRPARRSSDGVDGSPHRSGGPGVRLPRQGLDQLVPPLLARGSPAAGLHARTAERKQSEKHLPARGAGRLPAPRPATARSASPISAPPTEAGTTSPTQRKAPPARDSCATSSSRPPAPRRPAIAHAEPARRSAVELLTRPDGADGRPDMEPSPIPQSAGRVVDPVHEPRLDQPRRESARQRLIEVPLPTTTRHAIATSRAKS